MPVGVPKIPFIKPSSSSRPHPDLIDRLYRFRTLFLFQELTPELTGTLTGLMTYLNMDDSTLEQFLFINSTGGKMVNGLAVYDVIQGVIPDVHTICMGLAASMAALILSGGALTKRIAFPSARVMIHQPFAKLEGHPLNNWHDANVDLAEVMRLRKTVLYNYAKRSPHPAWVIVADMERDRFMSPTEARAYGLIDSIGTHLRFA
uniref:clp protease proteolytic subunit n=1 Tax=Pseudocodon convolvulaceus TaxID=1392590 RepID=UPI001EDE89DB|nr:clp protease proteolytic subunit [Pseudocodon convolvulaceus]UIG86695.1 clp protease proteolytic subunit [Pseudocodon convolvulaceus]